MLFKATAFRKIMTAVAADGCGDVENYFIFTIIHSKSVRVFVRLGLSIVCFLYLLI